MKNRDDRDLSSQGYRDSIQGKIDKFKGHVKDAAGGLTGDTSMKAKGKLDELKGKVEDATGRGERKIDRSLKHPDRHVDPSIDDDDL